jgi:hydroxymethylpyrimidine/phosphomethylpyrimidine kinase
MLTSVDTITVVANALQEHHVTITVIDPVRVILSESANSKF